MVGEMRVRRPDLLAVDDIAIAVAHRPRLQARQIGAGAGFAETLAPIILAGKDARQVMRLLLGRAELLDHRRQQLQAQHRQVRRVRQRAFLLEDVALPGDQPVPPCSFGQL